MANLIPVTEEELAAAAVAPRVTKQSIRDKIAEIICVRVTGTLTICAITMVNGFVVTGESACASPENYDKDIGERLAYEDAFRKLWALEGYVLCNVLARI